VRNRIMAALRHLFDLLEDQAVVISGERCPHREPKNHERNPSSPSLHDGISKRQNAIWQRPLSFLNVAALAATGAALCHSERKSCPERSRMGRGISHSNPITMRDVSTPLDMTTERSRHSRPVGFRDRLC
jgi:hypothetical protein